MPSKQNDQNFYGVFFRLCQKIVRMVLPKYTVQVPNALNGPVVYISHHQNLHSPFTILLWFTKSVHTWMLHVFLDQKACFQQYVDYTFTKRFGWNVGLAKLCAYPLSCLIAKLMNSGGGIPVYRGSRKIIQTFKLSLAALNRGESVLICPDIDYRDTSSITKAMYDGFLALEKYCFKANGRHVTFVPLYVSKHKKKIIAGEPIRFRDGTEFEVEKKVVREKIQSALNDLARACGDR